MTRTGRHSLMFDGLNLTDTQPGAEGYWFEAEADSATFGKPEPVEVGIKSLLADGAIVARTHDNNREGFFRIAVRGKDSRSLALGERALVLATNKQTTLVWTPPDGWSPPSYFDVLTSSLEPVFDDEAEMLHDERVYGLRLVMLPHSRSNTLRTQTHESATNPTVTEIDGAGSAAPWVNPSGVVDTAVTYQGDPAIKLVSTNPGSWVPAAITYQGSLGVGNYLAVDVAYNGWGGLNGLIGFGVPSIRKPAGGTPKAPIAGQALNAYFVRYFYDHPGGSDVELYWQSQNFTEDAPLYIGGLYRANQIPSDSSFLIPVLGSARTPATFEVVGNAGKGLLLFSDPLMATVGYDPSEENEVTWLRMPEGSYTAMFKLATPSSLAGDTVVKSESTYGSYTRQLGQQVTAGEFIDVGTAYVTRNYDGTSTVDLPTLTAYAPNPFSELFGAPITVTGSWRLFRRAPETRLIHVGSSTNLGSGPFRFIAPNLDFPRGAAFIGNTRLDGDRLKSWGFPLLTPPYTSVYCELGSEPNPELTVSYYDAHHTHVSAEVTDA